MIILCLLLGAHKMDNIFFILFKISSPPKISKYAKTSSCSEWSVNIMKRIYFVESAKPQNHPTIPDMPQTKSNRLLTLPIRYPRLIHTIHNFYTLSMTHTHYPQLLHTIHDFYTLSTTSTHYPRLLHTIHDFYTLSTTSTHYPRLLHTIHDFYTPPTSSTHHLRPPHTTYDLCIPC